MDPQIYTLIASQSDIKVTDIQSGDLVVGFYMGMFPFQGKVFFNKTLLGADAEPAIVVKLVADCRRPEDRKYFAGEIIRISLDGCYPSELLMHCRPC